VSPAPSRIRRAYIDWARGLAVLLMIEAHTLDAWTRLSSRTGRPFGYAAILGGFAAPLFLWLAGIGVALSAGSLSRRGERRGVVVETVARRGLEIFVLAFLFRLQAFIVSPGSYAVTLFRVDILNIMGPAIVASGIVWGLAAPARRSGTGLKSTTEHPERTEPKRQSFSVALGGPARLVAAYAGLACACAMVTPIVRAAAAVDALPIWWQWYIRPYGDYTTFTLFPWTGFVFAGAGCGVLLENASDGRTERRVLTAFAVAGAAVLVLGFATATRASIYAQSSFWTSSPTYFAIRVGVLMLGLAILAGMVGAISARRGLLLARLGRSSLFIYWIHVELVYGYATWPLRHRLPIWGTAVAFVLFSGLMYGAVVARDRLVEAWRTRQFYPAKRISV
jgi:uncharacterized membrane protein